MDNTFQARYTLGNLGQRYPTCKHEYFGVLKSQSVEEFTCDIGTLAKFDFIGMLPEDPMSKNELYCGDPIKYNDTQKCSNEIIDTQSFERYFKANCEHKTSCTVPVNSFLKINDDPPSKVENTTSVNPD